jgi:hypothetical protein
MTHISDTNGTTNDTHIKTNELRFLTRSISTLALLTGLIYLRVIGQETMASWQTNQGLNTITLLLGLLIVAIAGLLCGWRWEWVGGSIAIFSAIGIAILAYSSTTDYKLFSAVAYSSPFLVAGIFMLACWQRSQTNQ